MYIRLDRALATSEWMEQFKEARVCHIVDSTLDHCALLVFDSYHPQPPRKRRFHFEAMWTKRGDCRKIIEEMWSKNMSLNSPSDMALRLKQCAMELSKWNLYAFGTVPKKIQEKRRSLSNLVQRDRNGSLGREINVLRKEINDLLDSEENMWQQRSRVQWLGLGDRNTKYFHSKASERRKKNTITGLMDENGNWCDSTESIAAVAVSYFEKLFSTSYPSRISKVTNTIPTRVTDEMNQWLIKEFTYYCNITSSWNV